MVGDRERIAAELARLARAGYRDVIYTPTGADVARELRAFAARANATDAADAARP